MVYTGTLSMGLLQSLILVKNQNCSPVLSFTFFSNAIQNYFHPVSKTKGNEKFPDWHLHCILLEFHLQKRLIAEAQTGLGLLYTSISKQNSKKCKIDIFVEKNAIAILKWITWLKTKLLSIPYFLQ